MDPLFIRRPVGQVSGEQFRTLRDAANSENIFTSNLTSGVYGYGGSALLGLSNLAETAGFDNAAQGLRKRSTALLDTAGQFGTHHADMGSVTDAGSLWDSAKANMGQGLGSMLPIIASAPLGVVPGVAAATAPMYGENIARLEADQTLQGLSAGEKALYAAPTAAVQGALNYIVPGGLAGQLGKQIAARTGTGAAGKAATVLGTNMVVEGSTEAGEELARQGMHTFANPERDKSQDTQDLIQAGYSGALGGSPIGAVQAAGGYLQDKAKDTLDNPVRKLAEKAVNKAFDKGVADADARARVAHGALDEMEAEASARGVPFSQVWEERQAQRQAARDTLTKHAPDLNTAATEAEAGEMLKAHEATRAEAADVWRREVLADNDAAPAEKELAERTAKQKAAGAFNADELAAEELLLMDAAKRKTMEVVETINKLAEPIAGKPAPKNRRNEMVTKKLGDIEYTGPESDSQPAGEGAFTYTDFSGVQKNAELGQMGAEGRYGPEPEPFQAGTRRTELNWFNDSNRIKFYESLFDKLEARQQTTPADQTPRSFKSFEELGEFLKTQAEPEPAEGIDKNSPEYAKNREAFLIDFAKQNMELFGTTDQNEAIALARSIIRPRNERERHARQMLVLPPTNPVRTLDYSEWKMLDAALSNFAKGHGEANAVRTQLDQLFGSSEVTGRVLEMYREGRSGLGKALDTEGAEADTNLSDTGSDAITENDASFNSGTREFDAPEGGVARVSTGTSKPFFDTHDPDMLTSMMDKREDGLEEVGQIDYIKLTKREGAERRRAEDEALLYNYNRLPTSPNERKEMLAELNARHRTLVKHGAEPTGAKFDKADISDLRAKTTVADEVDSGGRRQVRQVGDKTTGLLFVEYVGKDGKVARFQTTAGKLISKFGEKANQDELLTGESALAQGAQKNRVKLYNGIGMLLEALAEQGYNPTGRIGYRDTPDAEPTWLDPSQPRAQRENAGTESLFKAGVNKPTYALPNDFNIGVGRGQNLRMSTANRVGLPSNRKWTEDRDNVKDMSLMDLELELSDLSDALLGIRLGQEKMFKALHAAVKKAETALSNAKKDGKTKLIKPLQEQVFREENALAAAKAGSETYIGMSEALEWLGKRYDEVLEEHKTRASGVGKDERVPGDRRETAEVETVSERRVEKVYERSLNGKKFSNRTLAENDADARQKVSGDPHRVEQRGGKFVVVGSTSERVTKRKSLSETEEMSENAKDQPIRERDESGEEISKAPKDAEGFFNRGEVEKDRRARSDTLRRAEELEQRGKMKDAAELRATLGGERNAIERMLASTLSDADEVPARAAEKVVEAYKKMDVLDQREMVRLLKTPFWEPVGYEKKARMLEARAKLVLNKLPAAPAAEEAVAEISALPRIETGQLKAFANEYGFAVEDPSKAEEKGLAEALTRLHAKLKDFDTLGFVTGGFGVFRKTDKPAGGRMGWRSGRAFVFVNESIFTREVDTTFDKDVADRVNRVLAHEIGHSVDLARNYSANKTFHPGGKLHTEVSNKLAETSDFYLEKMLGYALKNEKELFAQLFTIYVNRTEVMKNELPQAYEQFRKVFGAVDGQEVAGQRGHRDGSVGTVPTGRSGADTGKTTVAETAAQSPIEKQLRAYLPLAEQKNAVLAGAIKRALREISEGRSGKSHEGALAAAKKQLGELPADAAEAAVPGVRQDATTRAQATDEAALSADAPARTLTPTASDKVDLKFTDLSKADIAKLLEQRESDNESISEAAYKALERLEEDLIAKAKEIEKLSDDEARLRAIEGVLKITIDLDLEYDTFVSGFIQLERAAAVNGNAYTALRNDIARFASKDFLDDLDARIEETTDELGDVEDDVGGAVRRGLALLEELKKIKAEQESKQRRLFNAQTTTTSVGRAPSKADRALAEATGKAFSLRLKEAMEALGFSFSKWNVDAASVVDVLDIADKRLTSFTANEKRAIQEAAAALSHLMMSHKDFGDVRELINKDHFDAKRKHADKLTKSGVKRGDALSQANRMVLEDLIRESFAERAKSPVQKIVDAVRRLLGLMGQVNKTELFNKVDKSIAEFLADPSVLKGENKPRFEKVSFEKAIKEDPHARDVLEKLLESEKVALTGSLALATQGSIYRQSGNLMHDLDFLVVGNGEKGLNAAMGAVMKAFPDSQMVYDFAVKHDPTDTYKVITFLVPPAGRTVDNVLYEKGKVVGYTVKNRSGNVVGTFRSKGGVEHKKGERAIFVDLFSRETGYGATKPYSFTGADGRQIRGLMQTDSNTFAAKLRMGRQKDVWDYARYTPEETRKLNTQGPTNEVSKDMAEALAEVRKILGDKFPVEAVAKLVVDGQEISGDMQENLIRIAANAADVVGVGRHEALHQLFSWLRQHGSPSTIKLLQNVATNEIVMRQLRHELAEHPNALEQLKDPEEAAAYLFQFWLAKRINLGPKTETFFQNVLNMLNKLQLALREHVFGSKTAATERQRLRQEALAERIMGDLADGVMADPDQRVRVAEVLENNSKAVLNRRANSMIFGQKFHDTVRKAVFSNASIFEDSDNRAVQALGKMFFRMEGDKRSKQAYMERVSQETDKRLVKLRNVLHGVPKETLELVAKYMNDRRDTDKIHHPEAKKIVGELREILDEMRLFQAKAKTARWDADSHEWKLIGEVKENYWPRVWALDYLSDKQGLFLEKMVKALEKYRAEKNGYPEIDDFDAPTMARAILHRLINGQGALDIEETTSELGLTPYQASINKRSLEWLDDVAPGEFTEFMSKDAVEVMSNYITQAVKRSVYQEEFGYGGEKVREAMDEAYLLELGGEELAERSKSLLKAALRAWTVEMGQWHASGRTGPKPTMPTLRSVGHESWVMSRALEIYNETPEGKAKPVTLTPQEIKNAKERAAQAIGWIDDPVRAEARKQAEAEGDAKRREVVAKLEPVGMAVQALEGTLGHDINPHARHVMSMITTLQNWQKLPFALFASMNDIVGLVANGGTLSDSFSALVRGVREIKMMWQNTYSQDELAKLAEDLGVVGAGNYLNTMGQAYSSQWSHGKLRTWNDRLFKWNGLEAWNRAMRIQATGSAINFIKQHVTKPNEHSARRLEELFGEGYDTSKILDDKGEIDFSNDRVREAILAWVNGAVLRPNASHRPVYASDPHWMLFYHLKQFAYSFHKVILRRAWVEAKNGNYAPATSLLVGYVPVSIAADAVKELLIVGDDDPWWLKSGLTGYLEHGITRANLGGVPQLLLGDVVPDPIAMFKDPGAEATSWAANLTNVIGPAPDQVLDALTAPIFESKTIEREMAGWLPGGVLWRRYVD